MSLCGICTELNRGGNLIERALMVELVVSLSNQVLSCYESLLDRAASNPAALSQDGALQLLFDFNFVSDVLSSRIVYHAQEDNKQYTTRLEAVRSRLKERIDPFDLIVFDKPLQEARSRYYMRCEVILGNFMRLNRLYAGTKATLVTSDRDNMISLAPVVARFPLLPISSSKEEPALPTNVPAVFVAGQSQSTLSMFELLFVPASA